MPKNLNLFGSYLRYYGKKTRYGFKTTQLTKPIPVKALGKMPSASSQTGLYHNEDFNYVTKVRSLMLCKDRKKYSPRVFRKDISSDALNTTVMGLRVTTSALHAIDDMGGFDNYILRTPPQELRSNMGEKMRTLMHFYMENPDVREWGLPWKVLMRKRDQADPWFARHQHLLKKERSERHTTRRHARYSPYYLPGSSNMHPERQPFAEGSEEPQAINTWWKESPELEIAFRRRLSEYRGFDEGHPDHRLPGSYYKLNQGRGGGGARHNNYNPARLRSKQYRFHEFRAW
eukprot:GDKH01018658.1.p1 GENE.GDKH01018658.1~~GDKH01018658.1.p1  ORF type:complete len:288 (-),score=36.63 GDKH01018658.1:155-1018(-)